VTNTPEAAAGSYGAGLAPFFLSLALWIGAYVLFLVVKPLSSRALAAGQLSWRIALGGLYPPVLFGLAQCGLAFGVVFFGLGLHVAHPAAVFALTRLIPVSGGSSGDDDDTGERAHPDPGPARQGRARARRAGP
jgi:putative membrane protein